MMTLTKIKQFSNSNVRNKVVFSSNCIENLEYVDVGEELAVALSNGKILNLGQETIYHKIFEKTNDSDSIGKYLALKNIGILFEPELGLNLEYLLDNYSKNQLLFICEQGKVIDDTFFLYQVNEQFKINLKNLTFITI